MIKLLGTFQASRGIPGFILEPGLFRARRELFGFKVIIFYFSTIPLAFSAKFFLQKLNYCRMTFYHLFQALPRRSKGKNMLLERCRRILEQVGIALEHLHRKGLVHMELSLDTVMVLILIVEEALFIF